MLPRGPRVPRLNRFPFQLKATSSFPRAPDRWVSRIEDGAAASVHPLLTGKMHLARYLLIWFPGDTPYAELGARCVAQPPGFAQLSSDDAASPRGGDHMKGGLPYFLIALLENSAAPNSRVGRGPKCMDRL